MNGSAEIYRTVKEGTSRVIIGYEDIVEDILICLAAGGHILLEGVPGVAKTTLAKTVSEITGLDFKRIQFTQDLLPADITGHYFYNQRTQEFEFRKGPVFSNVVLADEINRAPSKTQSALLEAMEENQVTIEGTTFPLQEPFLVIATINPVELEGVYTLPEAQMDRFMMKGKMDYLDKGEELNLLKLKNRQWKNRNVDPMTGDTYSVLKKEIQHCRADEMILRYIRDIIFETRSDDSIILGASPRAGEQMLYAAKASAVLSGRDHVIPDDVKKISMKMIPHRLTLSLDSELEGFSPELVMERLLKRVKVVTEDGS
jgi:MoxR-like ATPase